MCIFTSLCLLTQYFFVLNLGNKWLHVGLSDTQSAGFENTRTAVNDFLCLLKGIFLYCKITSYKAIRLCYRNQRV